jgi:hypothetical protein
MPTPRQKELFHIRTGYFEFKDYLNNLPVNHEVLYIANGDNQLWESGFASYCMEKYDHESGKHGIKILLTKPLM